MELTGFAKVSGQLMELAGVVSMLAGIPVAAALAALHARRPDEDRTLYDLFRQYLGRGILLGLEFLVAADIIRTVSEDPSLLGVMILGLIVLIRTFLSFTLGVELEGRWPWQRKPETGRSGT